jgi:eukaryotic-like serine/threonine-protein kinase
MTENRRPTSLIGSTLNGIYEVTRFIARGGMGEVYEGKNVNSDERVAIKVILPEHASNPKVQAMFLKEARTLTKLSHPALVQYRVLAQEPEIGCLYIAMDFIDGTSLSDVLSSYGPTLPELTALTRRLADGLRVAHDLGAIHRDISPDNVLLERGRLERARIIDFGIAKDTTPGSATIVGDGFAGKLGYVAPEQLGDFDREIGPWTDVYSLGLVILSFARGAPSNMGTSLVDAVEMRRKPADLSDIPAELRPLLQAMLVPDPRIRLRSMGEVIDVIDRSNYQRTMFAPPETMLQPGLGTPPPPLPSAPAPSAAVEPPAGAVPVAAAQKSSASRGKLGLIGGGVAAAALAATGAWYFMGSGTGGDALSIAQAAALEVECGWLNVEVDADTGGLALNGAAGDVDAAKAAIESAVAAGGKSTTVAVNYVAPLEKSACPVIEALKTARTDTPLIKPEQYEYELKIGGAPKNPDMQGKPAAVAHAELKFDPAQYFALYDFKLSGEREIQLKSDALERALDTQALVKSPSGGYRLNADVEKPEWFGMILATGDVDKAETANILKVETMDPAQIKQFVADNPGWKIDVSWIHLVDKVPG